jgi:hypothetical protein
MGLVQQIVLKMFPASKSQAIKAESQAWMVRCDVCDEEKSVWDRGGVRWKGAGTPRLRAKCTKCGKTQWHTIYYSK